jgi:hypothetical protein
MTKVKKSPAKRTSGTPSALINSAKVEAKETPFKIVSAIHGLVSVVFLPRTKKQKSGFFVLHKVGDIYAVYSTFNKETQLMDRADLSATLKEIRADFNREQKGK